MQPVSSQSLSSQVPVVITREELFELIDVHNPYFALEDVQVDEQNNAIAWVMPHQPLGSEVLPIVTAEACRHLAILGTVSCAFANPVKKKHYYLAYKGTFKKIAEPFGDNWEQPLKVHATCTFVDKRKAHAQCYLTDAEGNFICETEVSYHVILHSLFERLYQSNFKQQPDFSIENPYTLKNQLFEVETFDTGATASLSVIEDKYCAGHFPHFPAMPVANLMSKMLTLCSHYIHHVTQEPSLKISVKALALKADNLAFAGEKVDLSVKQLENYENLFVLHCIAMVGEEKSVGDIIFTIETVQVEV